jgi:hypothetical protein
MASKENRIKQDCLRYLRDRGHTAWICNVGKMKGYYKTGQAGLPDIIGYHRITGLFIGIECGTPEKNWNTARGHEQTCFLFNLNKSGGIGLKAENVEDLFEDGRI